MIAEPLELVAHRRVLNQLAENKGPYHNTPINVRLQLPLFFLVAPLQALKKFANVKYESRIGFAFQSCKLLENRFCNHGPHWPYPRTTNTTSLFLLQVLKDSSSSRSQGMFIVNKGTTVPVCMMSTNRMILRVGRHIQNGFDV